MPEIETLTHELKYSNKWMEVYEDRILRQGNREGLYGVVEKSEFSIIIPVEDDSVYMVEQYRYPLKERTLEFPQGSAEKTDLNPEENARRELKEETGITAGSITYLGSFYTAVGFSNQKGHIFLATDFTFGTPHLDETESDLITKKVKVSRLQEMISTSFIKDSGTITAWAHYLLKQPQ